MPVAALPLHLKLLKTLIAQLKTANVMETPKKKTSNIAIKFLNAPMRWLIKQFDLEAHRKETLFCNTSKSSDYARSHVITSLQRKIQHCAWMKKK